MQESYAVFWVECVAGAYLLHNFQTNVVPAGKGFQEYCGATFTSNGDHFTVNFDV